MRSKFKTYGDKVFETYELLEMMLYFVIPAKDTNPLAKRLLLRFSSLEGLVHATREELLSVEGVGEKVADFLLDLFCASEDIENFSPRSPEVRITDYVSAGEMFVRYFNSFETKEERNTTRIVMAMLDSNLALLSLAELYNVDFSSATVQSRPFIEAAVSAHAAVVMLAHNHPYGPLFHTESDVSGTKLIRDDLETVGITLAEHFVISGNDFKGISAKTVRMRLGQRNTILEKFIRDCARFTSDTPTNLGIVELEDRKQKLLNLLSIVFSDAEAEEMSTLLSDCFPRFSGIFYSDFHVLKEAFSSERAAIFLKLVGALRIRRKTDSFAFGKPHTEESVGQYFCALIGNAPLEQIYVMLFDEKDRAIACEFVADGTVTATTLSPRRIYEIARRNAAANVVLAHNHPGGEARPSSEDFSSTIDVARLLASVGMSLRAHYVVTGDDYYVIDGGTVSP